MRIYLAGTIAGLSYEQATGWRRDIKKRLPGFKFYDPMKGKEGLAGTKSLPATYNDRNAHARIVRGDLLRVNRSDIVLANLTGSPRVSIGTIFEIGYAYHAGKMILCVMGPEDMHHHPFIEENAVMFETIDQAIEFIKTLPHD